MRRRTFFSVGVNAPDSDNLLLGSYVNGKLRQKTSGRNVTDVFLEFVSENIFGVRLEIAQFW